MCIKSSCKQILMPNHMCACMHAYGCSVPDHRMGRLFEALLFSRRYLFQHLSFQMWNVTACNAAVDPLAVRRDFLLLFSFIFHVYFHLSRGSHLMQRGRLFVGSYAGGFMIYWINGNHAVMEMKTLSGIWLDNAELVLWKYFQWILGVYQT